MLDIFRRVGFVPRACGWELTLRCNMGCTHCGSLAGRARDDELDTDACLRLADDVIALGCQRVTLTGGEPTLHPAWDRVAQRLTAQKARVALISNAWAWQASDAERAVGAGIGTLGFSLDGLEVEHDGFRVKGSFARVLDAIASARAVGAEVAVNTTLHRDNRHQLSAMREVLIGAGVRSWQLQYAIPTGAMAEHRDRVLPAEDLVWLVPEIAELCRERKGGMYVVASDHIGYFGKPETHLRQADVSMPFWLGCWAGMHVLGIESNGNVKGCLSLPSERHGHVGYVEGNVRCESLRDIWQRKSGFRYNRGFRTDDLRGFCRVCRYGDICRGGCTWKRTSQMHPAAGDIYCFYYQAVKQRRHDLLDDEPTAEETAFLHGQ